MGVAVEPEPAAVPEPESDEPEPDEPEPDELVLESDPSLVSSVSTGLGTSVAVVEVSNRDSSTNESNDVGDGTEGRRPG